MKNTSFIDETALLKRQQRIAGQLLPSDHICHEISDRLLERLDFIRINPERILNVGWHTEYPEKKCRERYPTALLKTAHDFAAINHYDNNSFDLVIVHFALLHSPQPQQLLAECARVLRDEGLLLFTSLGPDTLFELNNSFLSADQFFHVHPFTDMHDIGDWMRSLHFSDPVVDREEITIAYDDLNQLFKDLKSAGATNIHINRQRGLLSRQKWQKMLAHYATLKTDDYFPATLEIIYGHGWKVQSMQIQNKLTEEIAISVNDIKRR